MNNQATQQQDTSVVAYHVTSHIESNELDLGRNPQKTRDTRYDGSLRALEGVVGTSCSTIGGKLPKSSPYPTGIANRNKQHLRYKLKINLVEYQFYEARRYYDGESKKTYYYKPDTQVHLLAIQKGTEQNYNKVLQNFDELGDARKQNGFLVFPHSKNSRKIALDYSYKHYFVNIHFPTKIVFEDYDMVEKMDTKSDEINEHKSLYVAPQLCEQNIEDRPQSPENQNLSQCQSQQEHEKEPENPHVILQQELHKNPRVFTQIRRFRQRMRAQQIAAYLKRKYMTKKYQSRHRQQYIKVCVYHPYNQNNRIDAAVV